MMKKGILFMAVLVMFALVVSSCGKSSSEESSSSSESSSSQESSSTVSSSSSASSSSEPESSSKESSSAVELLSELDAKAAVKQSLSDDFEGYQVTLNQADLKVDGRAYYQYLIVDTQIALEPSIIVDQITGELFAYYPDQTMVPLGDDQVFGNRDWSGNYSRDGSKDPATMRIEMADSGSFEFTMELVHKDQTIKLDYHVAHMDSADKDKAFFDDDEGFRLIFTREDGKIKVAAEGNPEKYYKKGMTFDGTYTK